MKIEWSPILLSLKLSIVTVFILFIVSFPLAYLLHRSRGKMRIVAETLLTLPLVLPPTVIGFYLLLLLSPRGGFGHWLESVFHMRLVFNFSGLVIASCVYSIPFMMLPLKSGLDAIPQGLVEASATLGKGPFETLIRVQIPNMKGSIINALAVTFAHTMGEFGIVLMIGGNIPGQTRLASVAIFDCVENLDYKTASEYSLIMIVIAALFLFIANGCKGSKTGGANL